ncbi:glutaminyl-peptide cyclotransferase [Maricaulis sp.]|uniref:glutaminyl-peptide cyclotransferase n=1 Tax=Maricaulis sp. TaxID=1486257 RepID=UPI000C40D7E3|nr:glutaminyl-peptide cyclotransferase [Maricaulis sp.]MAC90664.1 glutamine cyclotransferase [Maricaulis sp.]
MIVRILTLTALWIGLPLAACAQAPQIIRPEVVAEYPHDPAAFTQGLFIHEGELFESTGRVGQSSLRRVDLETGQVEQSVAIAPPVFGEGSARIGDEIFMLSWVSERGFIFNAETFEQIDSFSYPGEGWGLTFDGTHLILSDGTPELRFLDPATMTLSHTINVTMNGRPIRRLNELEWIDGMIWANIWETRSIVRIDPQTGAVDAMIDLSALVPPEVAGRRDAVANGIAWNARTGQIYVTGKLWPTLYEIRLPEPSD